MKNLILSLYIGLLLTACTSVSTPAATLLPVLPTSVPTLREDLSSSPTAIQLPFNSEVQSDEYCKPPYAILPVSDGDDISEDEIVYELVKIWLRRYNQPNAPAFCRIDDYTIDKVYDDPGVYSNALEPRGDFMRVIAFSVKLIQVPSYWMSFPGELDQNNWLHSGHIVAVSETDEGYRMEFANP